MLNNSVDCWLIFTPFLGSQSSGLIKMEQPLSKSERRVKPPFHTNESSIDLSTILVEKAYKKRIGTNTIIKGCFRTDDCISFIGSYTY